MKNLKAKALNRKAANKKSRPDDILKAMDLKPGMVIVDIGAGGGYFTLRFAEIVGDEGRVYAVDTNSTSLKFIEGNAFKKGLNNVHVVLANDTLNLPLKKVDVIFMRNVTHHIPDRIQYFKNLRKFLKIDGRIAIIEYKKSKFLSFRGIFGHYVSKKALMHEMLESGYTYEKEYDFLPEQYFVVYSNVSVINARGYD
ncbi:class I SAM-dependent methyltransferase [Thermovirga sp.]|uniref:class I SAM-dependent methyltransferase n=1 Tax=Thermovirga sp. TaxID=2699834 RepID=UPI0025D5131E|nr:class I SAM-dependent methyltransferase [Thermovirga sp.]MBO8154278.1 class I SAM-dependent methyltransferase [Thermovirga sp.]